MAASFDWTHTDPVLATIDFANGALPALYSMDILVKNDLDLYSLRGLGIHTQTQPLLSDEQAVWDGTIVKAMSPQGSPVGVWITAIVPGPVYNDLRSQALAGIANGHPIGIKAMVFRRIHLIGAALYPNPDIVVSPLNPTFLIQQGLDFNGYTARECNSDGTCTVMQASVWAWFAQNLISPLVDLVVAVVDGIRELVGWVERIVRGDVAVTIHLDLYNFDPVFGKSEL